MKITESKYYVPHKIVRTDDFSDQVIIDDQPWANRDDPYLTLLDFLLSSIRVREADLVIAQDKLVHFERCTDFTSLAYSAKKRHLYEVEQCYYHAELELFIIANTDLSNDYDDERFEQGMLKITHIFYDATHPAAYANVSTLLHDYLQPYCSNEAQIAILVKEFRELEIKKQRIKPLPMDIEGLYNDDFAAVDAHIREQLANTNKGLVLLHGIPGSGKTNYIKWLSGQVPDKQFIFVPTPMIAQLTDPSLISLLTNNPNSVFVLEDCEQYISQRSADSRDHDVVASILNLADGILSDAVNCQFICTFNADLTKVDKALLRKGRLIAEYRFGKLDRDKANQWLTAQGSDQRVDTPITLADLTNLDQPDMRSHEIISSNSIL